MPYVSWFGGDLCESMTGDEIKAQVGSPPMEIFDMSDDGSILVGRTGSFFTGFVGALWIERVGWMTWDDFFRKQGVVEASNTPFSNPISISGTGTEVVGGMVGASFSWLVNMSQVFVCERGNSIQTGFPNGLRAKIAAGAKLGRCEHLERLTRNNDRKTAPGHGIRRGGGGNSAPFLLRRSPVATPRNLHGERRTRDSSHETSCYPETVVAQPRHRSFAGRRVFNPLIVNMRFLISARPLAPLAAVAALGACATPPSLPDPLAAGWNGAPVCERLHEDSEQRVLRCSFPPSAGHERHFHGRHFGYAIAGGRMRITDASGTREVDLATGSSFTSPGVAWHEVLNIGDTTVVYLIVEPK